MNQGVRLLVYPVKVSFTRSIAPLFTLDTLKGAETYENNDM